MSGPQDRRQGWAIPAALGAETDDLYVFPWPTRDEALVLFDVEDLGAAGPAAGSLALLRSRAEPEVLWKSGPFVAFLDEYWLGVAHTVWFTSDAAYAFARPYLRGLYDESFLFVIRAKDRRCAVLTTPFAVLRAEPRDGGGFRVHALPDPSIRVLRPEHHAALQGMPPRDIEESALDWFDGGDLYARRELLWSKRTDVASKPPER